MNNNVVTITHENFDFYAVKAYTHVCLSKAEFLADVKLFDMVAKGLKTNIKNLRLLVNYVVLIFNSFDANIATELLIYKVLPQYHSGLKTLLWYLCRLLPNTDLDNLDLDYNLLDRIREEL